MGRVTLILLRAQWKELILLRFVNSLYNEFRILILQSNHNFFTMVIKWKDLRRAIKMWLYLRDGQVRGRNSKDWSYQCGYCEERNAVNSVRKCSECAQAQSVRAKLFRTCVQDNNDLLKHRQANVNLLMYSRQ